mmetsp:Transcript_9663/g.30970  ORF Transcript_9663/g.30970 Transcript_9663/m.30970 type:complete len:206 (+) Transcript_9663:277-894(+)
MRLRSLLSGNRLRTTRLNLRQSRTARPRLLEVSTVARSRSSSSASFEYICLRASSRLRCASMSACRLRGPPPPAPRFLNWSMRISCSARISASLRSSSRRSTSFLRAARSLLSWDCLVRRPRFFSLSCATRSASCLTRRSISGSMTTLRLPGSSVMPTISAASSSRPIKSTSLSPSSSSSSSFLPRASSASYCCPCAGLDAVPAP